MTGTGNSPHRLRHMPALDGLRALAVTAVVAYHLGLPWARGGYLGVDLFFVLSGFLITGLLAGERATNGGVRLGAFYARRAQRLLPALFLVLAAVEAFSARTGMTTASLRGDVASALGYVANWRFITAGRGYFDQFSVPSPLRHTWSLAIEEQYYLLWPLLLLALLRLVRGSRRRAAGATVAMALASALAMALLYHPGADPSRAYYGTDSRCFALLLGSALALVLSSAGPASVWTRRALHAAGAAALAALGLASVTVADSSGWMYRGGFLAVAVLAAVTVASISRSEAGPLGTFLSARPLRWLGQRSYGVYLWHWPVIVLLTRSQTGLSGWYLRGAQVTVTLAASALSYRLVELPIRSGAWRGWRLRVAAPLTAGALATGLAVVGVAPAVARAAPATPPAAALAAGAPISTPDPPPPPPRLRLSPGRVPTPQDPLRVLIVGDSVMYDAAPGIVAALQATGVVHVDSQPVLGFGLTRSYPWRSAWPRLVAEKRAELVLALFGGWDGPTAATDGWGKYASLVDEALSALRSQGAAVVLLEYPRTRPPDIPGRPAVDQAANDAARDLVDSVLAAASAGDPAGVGFLPTAPVLELGGSYSAFLPGPDGTLVRARKHDDI
ncbi:MAG TPA: acyltransferase family protein, partial [Acidimicrobiales bacterium]|nr:acyltransferase family protein [Acidimicrobiales bacterium]